MKTIDDLKVARRTLETSISRAIAEFGTEYKISDLDVKVTVNRTIEAGVTKEIKIITSIDVVI